MKGFFKASLVTPKAWSIARWGTLSNPSFMISLLMKLSLL
jgi:hypothetical protein